MRSLLVGLMLVSLVLAGCTSDKEKDGDGATATSTTSSSASTTTSSTGTTTSSTSTSTAPSAAQNAAPTGSISASINGTRVDFNLTGADTDGDALTWTLAFGDGNTTNGASLPAQVNHTYLAGNYSAVFNVTDGTDSASYNVSLAIVASAAAAGAQTVSGGWDMTNGHCVGASSTTIPSAAWFPSPLKGVNHDSFAVDAATHGKPFTVVFTYAADTVGGITFVDAEGAYLSRTITEADPVTVAGNVPAGATTAYLFSCLGEPGGATATYTAG